MPNTFSVAANGEDKTLTYVSETGVKEVYSLQEEPPVGSTLVTTSKKEIMQDLQLDTIITNLHNSAGLMYVAYNALAGTKIQSKMSGLQKSLLDMCSDCIVAVQDFEAKSGDILNNILKLYKWLSKGREQLALKQIAHAAEKAAAMAKTSEELAAGFNALASTTESILEESQDEENIEYEKIQALKKQLRELEAKQAKAEEAQKGLVADIAEMQTLYDEAKDREETANNRQFALSIVSACTSAIGSGVAAFVATQNPVGTTLGAMTRGNTPPGKELNDEVALKSKEAAAAKLESEKLDREATAKESELAAAKVELQNLQDQLSTALELVKSKQEEVNAKTPLAKDKADDSDEVVALNAAKEALEGAKTAATDAQKAYDAKSPGVEKLKTEASSARTKATDKTASYAGVAAALKDLSESTAKMQQQSMDAAASIHAEKMEYLNKKLAMQKEQREGLADLAEYAKLVENTGVDTNIASAAVDTLHVAVRCLKQIVTSLSTAALFWRSMERFCKALVNSKLAEEIDDLKDEDLEVRLEEYGDPTFMYTLLKYMSRWLALNLVCKDYLKAVNEVHGKVVNNIQQAPTIEEARAAAPALAGDMLTSVNDQIEKMDLVTSKLEEEVKVIA